VSFALIPVAGVAEQALGGEPERLRGSRCGLVGATAIEDRAIGKGVLGGRSCAPVSS
jgi:hypothetical protein